MVQIEQSLSAIRVWKGYIAMAMGDPRLQKFLAMSMQISQCPTRIAFRALIAAKGAIFLTPFPSCFQSG